MSTAARRICSSALLVATLASACDGDHDDSPTTGGAGGAGGAGGTGAEAGDAGATALGGSGGEHPVAPEGCEPGEFVVSGEGDELACAPCPEGTYSFEQNAESCSDGTGLCPFTDRVAHAGTREGEVACERGPTVYPGEGPPKLDEFIRDLAVLQDGRIVALKVVRGGDDYPIHAALLLVEQSGVVEAEYLHVSMTDESRFVVLDDRIVVAHTRPVVASEQFPSGHETVMDLVLPNDALRTSRTFSVDCPLAALASNGSRRILLGCQASDESPATVQAHDFNSSWSLNLDWESEPLLATEESFGLRALTGTPEGGAFVGGGAIVESPDIWVPVLTRLDAGGDELPHEVLGDNGFVKHLASRPDGTVYLSAELDVPNNSSEVESDLVPVIVEERRPNGSTAFTYQADGRAGALVPLADGGLLTNTGYPYLANFDTSEEARVFANRIVSLNEEGEQRWRAEPDGYHGIAFGVLPGGHVILGGGDGTPEVECRPFLRLLRDEERLPAD